MISLRRRLLIASAALPVLVPSFSVIFVFSFQFEFCLSFQNKQDANRKKAKCAPIEQNEK